MSRPRPWFRQGELRKTFKVGNTIEFNNPEPSKWTITAITEEDDTPTYERDGAPACTSAKLSCKKVGEPSKRAFVRVFVQIPYMNTEFEDVETRRRQATRYKPEELIAFEKLSNEPAMMPALLGWHEGQQGNQWPVPNGFLVYYGWEDLDGLRLGDVTDKAPAFWLLDRLKRDLIRAAFQQVYRRCQSLGVWPSDPSPNNLLWIPSKAALLWVDCREWGFSEKLDGPVDYWFAQLDLAKGPQDRRTWARWNGDTSDWEW